MSVEYTWRSFETGDGIKIMGCSRPGYPAKHGIQESVVSDWIEEVKKDGFKSIICLLDKAQLDFYASLEAGGLLETYKAAGLKVFHYPVADHQYPPIDEMKLSEILNDLKAMPDPILVHCSAGCDRTGALMEYVMDFS